MKAGIGAWTLSVLMLAAAPLLPGQEGEFNYDETKVPAYVLPDPLLTADGRRVGTAREWQEVRRPEILELFRSQMYGRRPGPPRELRSRVASVEPRALGGAAVRKEVSLYFSPQHDRPRMDLLIYLPASGSGPVPAFLGLNFSGNHSVHPDPGISLPETWMRPSKVEGAVVENRATELGRGTLSRRWPVEKIIGRGYALVTAYYGDIDPDYDDGFRNGVHPLYYRPGQTRPDADEWGSIAAWAWGLSRALDYLATDPGIDQDKVAVLGHSRLGKTALWGGRRRRAFRPGHLQQLRLRGSGPEPPPLRRDRRQNQPGLSPLVLRELQAIRRQGGDAPDRPAPAGGPDGSPPGLRGQRGGGPVGGPERRVPFGPARRPRLRVAGTSRTTQGLHARGEPAPHGHHRLPHPERTARRDRLRLGPVPGLRRPAPAQSRLTRGNRVNRKWPES